MKNEQILLEWPMQCDEEKSMSVIRFAFESEQSIAIAFCSSPQPASPRLSDFLPKSGGDDHCFLCSKFSSAHAGGVTHAIRVGYPDHLPLSRQCRHSLLANSHFCCPRSSIIGSTPTSEHAKGSERSWTRKMNVGPTLRTSLIASNASR